MVYPDDAEARCRREPGFRLSRHRRRLESCEVRIALGGLEAAMCRGESGVFRAADGACSGRVQWRPRPVHDTKAAQKAATTPMRTSAREFRGRLALRLYVG